MKLYRIILVTPTANITRGVWADFPMMADGITTFYSINEEGSHNIVAAYPSNILLITNIETKEEYDANREKSDTYLTTNFEKLSKK